jgi:hypothetical protein
MQKKVLLLLSDCPGYFVEMMYRLAEQMRAEGIEPIFAATSPYYEKYKGKNLSEVGKVYYLSEFMEKTFHKEELATVKINYWWIYPSFVRQKYFLGRHINDWDEYRKVVLFHQHVLDLIQPDLVLSEPPSNTFLYTGYAHIQEKGIPYLGYLTARIPQHFNVFLDAYGESLLKNHQTQSKGIDNSGGPDHMQNKALPLNQPGILKKITRMFNVQGAKSLETGFTPNFQMHVYMKLLWRQWRYWRALRGNLFVDEVDFREKATLLFPLHYRPEASTSVLARYYENDYELLKNIAFSLPSHVQLVVKEHSAAVGIRGVDFYEKVLTLPNTILLHPDYSLAENLTKFDAVITLTSTVGFEALQEGLQVFVLGNCFYKNYPGVTRIESFAELEAGVRGVRRRENKKRPEILEIYQKCCFPGRFNYMDAKILELNNIAKLLVPVRQVLRQNDLEGLYDN